jgi:uncharacterized protein YifE (UPF0438 family)
MRKSSSISFHQKHRPYIFSLSGSARRRDLQSGQNFGTRFYQIDSGESRFVTAQDEGFLGNNIQAGAAEVCHEALDLSDGLVVNSLIPNGGFIWTA